MKVEEESKVKVTVNVPKRVTRVHLRAISISSSVDVFNVH